MSRSFTVVQVDGREVQDGGRYMSSSPMGAAKKAGSRIMRKSGKNMVQLTVMEKTRDSKKKEYSYQVKKVKVNEMVVRGGVQILYKFKTVAKSL